MEESELVAETLGEQVFNYVLLNKRKEWQEYRCAGDALRAEEQPRDALSSRRETMSTSERSQSLTHLARIGFSRLAEAESELVELAGPAGRRRDVLTGPRVARCRPGCRARRR